MKLFYVPGTCSLSPHILLREMGADFRLDRVDRKTKISEAGTDYNALNPKGYVPGLQLEDGTFLTEGVAIAQFLADQKGGERIAPAAGTLQRYKMNEWLVFIATEVHKNFSPLFRKSADPVPRQTLEKRLAFLAQELSGRDFLLGEKLSAADVYLFAVLRWAPRAEIELPETLQRFMARMRARPGVAEALRVEGLT